MTKTKTLSSGTVLVAWMGTTKCHVGPDVECFHYKDDDDCICPGAKPPHTGGPGMWIEKHKYLELKLLGKIT